MIILEAIWKFFVLVIQGYLDIVIAILIVIVTIGLVLFPLLLVSKSQKIISNKAVKTVVAGGLLGLYFVLAIQYYKTIPKDYVSYLCWRSEGQNSCPPSIMLSEEKLNIFVHFNILLVGQMDSFFMKNRLPVFQDDEIENMNFSEGKELLFLVMKAFLVIIKLPALIIKYVLWLVWSYALTKYWYFCPHVFGSIGALVELMRSGIFSFTKLRQT